MLVIDDEPSIRLLCRVNLEAEGIEVLEAGDGSRGVELARAVAVDAIVLDVMLPGLDGWESSRSFSPMSGRGRFRSSSSRAAPSCATARSRSAWAASSS